MEFASMNAARAHIALSLLLMGLIFALPLQPLYEAMLFDLQRLYAAFVTLTTSNSAFSIVQLSIIATIETADMCSVV